jgi:CheY-specific phosphatase CheX
MNRGAPINGAYLSAMRDITITLFETMLQSTVKPRDAHPENDTYELTAAVGYAGNGKGGLLLECNNDQAGDWCSRLCSLPPPVSAEDARDGLGEICNILAGNLKPLLPGGSTLATPLVWGGRTEYRVFAGCELAGSVELNDSAGPFRVSLFLG